MAILSRSHYLPTDGGKLYTIVLLPDRGEKFPTVIFRSPYVDHLQNMTDEEVRKDLERGHGGWVERGYAVVFQHCRGRGLSEGEHIPYIYERADGLALQAWIRTQSFYNGELYLCGGSYTASVHYCTAPFAPDIKGAVFEVQETERYDLNFRNGFYKIGLHGRWYVENYKRKTMPQKPYVTESFNLLPLTDFSRSVLGEKDDCFDEVLMHPNRDDPFWDSELGGGYARHALRHAGIPMLITTAFYDIYTQGIFDMWRDLDEDTRAKCAMVVNPYDHGGGCYAQPIRFPRAHVFEEWPAYAIQWLDYVRGKQETPFPLGKVTYYKLFGECWCCDDFDTPTEPLDLPIGTGEATYTYNPYAPAYFKGGLSGNFDGAAYQDPPGSRYDILSYYTPAFDEDTYIKGQMSARLKVRSDCEDTCFYMRLSLTTEGGDFGLRDDIHALSEFAPDYTPGEDVVVDFTFDEHAFVIKKGARLRIDISSSALPYYVRHTNTKGHFATQTQAKVAQNTVAIGESTLRLPVCKNDSALKSYLEGE